MTSTVLVMLALTVRTDMAYSQSQETQQLLLNIEKLAQLKQILSDMERGYRILNTGYSTVKDLTEGNFSLHKTFLDGLLDVSPAVRNYKKVAEIVNYQVQMVREYRAAQQRFSQSGRFSAEELAYLGRVYERLFDQSLKNLDELAMVVTAGKLRMGDDERLQAIDRIHLQMLSQLDFLRAFNNDNSMLALQRAKALREIQRMRSIQSIQP